MALVILVTGGYKLNRVDYPAVHTPQPICMGKVRMGQPKYLPAENSLWCNGWPDVADKGPRSSIICANVNDEYPKYE